MPKRILSLLFFTLILSCAKEDSMDNKSIVIPENQKTPLTPAQINARIDESINSKGTFNWCDADSHMLWSAVINGNNVVTIGFGNAKANFERIKTSNNAKIQNELLAIIIKYEQTNCFSKFNVVFLVFIYR